MAKCPDCNKFCGLEMQDPEVNDLDLTIYDAEEGEDERTGSVSWDVRIVRNSECCGAEVKESYFCSAGDITIYGHTGEECELTIEETSCEPTEEGGGRYAKSYYGCILEGEITCSCGKPVVIKDFGGTAFEGNAVTIGDKVAASEMDELC